MFGVRRLLFIAGLLLVSIPNLAQMRGGVRGSGGARTGFASRSFGAPVSGRFGTVHRSGFGFGTTAGTHFGRPFRDGDRFHHHHRFRGAWGYAYWGYPLWGYYDPWFDYSSDDREYASNDTAAY